MRPRRAGPPEIVALPEAAPIEVHVETSPKKRRRGQRVELTVEIGRTIVSAIAAGNFPSVACRLAGVGLATLDGWLKKGEQGKQPFEDFATAYRHAELEGESAMVEDWKNAGKGDWRANSAFLAKRHPERWSDHAARVAVLGHEADGPPAALFQINIHLGEGEPPTVIEFPINRAVEKFTVPAAPAALPPPDEDATPSE